MNLQSPPQPERVVSLSPCCNLQEATDAQAELSRVRKEYGEFRSKAEAERLHLSTQLQSMQATGGADASAWQARAHAAEAAAGALAVAAMQDLHNPT